jgi:hypothetical protein
MKKTDVFCPECNAGYRRIELFSGRKSRGEYRCLLCDHLIEVFDGTSQIAIRLTVQPEKILEWHASGTGPLGDAGYLSDLAPAMTAGQGYGLRELTEVVETA